MGETKTMGQPSMKKVDTTETKKHRFRGVNCITDCTLLLTAKLGCPTVFRKNISFASLLEQTLWRSFIQLLAHVKVMTSKNLQMRECMTRVGFY